MVSRRSAAWSPSTSAPRSAPMAFGRATHLHLAEWAAEGVGTALLLLGGLSSVCLHFGPHSRVAQAIPSTSARLLLTGALFAGSGSLVAVSPLGRLSGAHLNPVVTLAFRITGGVHSHDLLGYIAAQLAGAIAGSAAVLVAWGDTARAVGLGMTRPAASTSDLTAVAVEALMTAILVATILVCVANRRLARWTPLAVWVVVALLVWRGAPTTGTSLNPARSLGPAVLEGSLGDYWVYVAGPAAGATVVALLAVAVRRRPLTVKLFHDRRYPSTHASALPVAHPGPIDPVAAPGGAVDAKARRPGA